MKGIPTENAVIESCESGRMHYGFVWVGKKQYCLAQIQPGEGILPILEFSVTNRKSAWMLFHDIFTQLKAVFEVTPEKLTRTH